MQVRFQRPDFGKSCICSLYGLGAFRIFSVAARLGVAQKGMGQSFKIVLIDHGDDYNMDV
jgi:hypothetical protein